MLIIFWCTERDKVHKVNCSCEKILRINYLLSLSLRIYFILRRKKLLEKVNLRVKIAEGATESAELKLNSWKCLSRSWNTRLQ